MNETEEGGDEIEESSSFFFLPLLPKEKVRKNMMFSQKRRLRLSMDV